MQLLDLEVPEYDPSNDPLLSYSTPLSPYELHTHTRKDIVVRVDPTEQERQVAAIGSDHDYETSASSSKRAASSGRQPRRAAIKARKLQQGQLVTQTLDYKSIVWPRDALYLTYEPHFEFIAEDAAIGEDAFVCDCCDPAKQKKREDDDDEDEEEEEDDDEEDEVSEVQDSDSKDSSSVGSSKISSLGCSINARVIATLR